MFEARLPQSSTLKKLLDAIRDLIPQANFDCSADGISMQGVDQSHVSLILMTLRSQAFEQYRCDRSLSLGIHLANFAKVLRCAGNDDSLKITADDDSPDCAEFMFESAKGDRVAHFQLKLMDIDCEQVAVPEPEYTTVVTMPSAEYRRICTDLAVLGENVTIEVNKNSACFSVDGDIGVGALTINQTSAVDEKEEDAVTIDCQEPVKMTFPGQYLLSYTKAGAVSPVVSLFLRDMLPLGVEFNLPDEHGYVRFYLAPKVDVDAQDDDAQAKEEDE